MATGSKDELVESDRGGIREYYLREKKGQCASCKKCRFTVQCAGGSTSGLHTHQRTKHGNSMLKHPTTETSTNSNISNNKVFMLRKADMPDDHTTNVCGGGKGIFSSWTLVFKVTIIFGRSHS